MAGVPDGQIRVLSLTDVREMGGSERRQLTLSREMDPERFQVETVILESEGALHQAFSEIGQVARTLDLRTVFSWPGDIAGVLATLTRFKPHIIHGQLRWSGLLTATLGRYSPWSRAVVSRVHTFGTQRRVERFVEWTTYRAAHGVVAVCEAAAAQVRRLYPAADVTVIPNGVSLDRFRGLEEKKRSEVFRVVCVANFNPVKGHAMLFDAVERLTNTDLMFEVTLVGDGSLRTELEARALQQGMPIRFVGRQDDVVPFLAEADLFVLPSNSEGMSNALIEAMAAGLPTLSTRVGGNVEVTVEHETGLLVSVGDAQGMAGAILELSRDRARLHQMAEAARIRAFSEYSQEKMIQAYQEFYTRQYAVLNVECARTAIFG